MFLPFPASNAVLSLPAVHVLTATSRKRDIPAKVGATSKQTASAQTTIKSDYATGA